MHPFLALPVVVLLLSPQQASEAAARAECADWRQCREQALAAAGRGEFGRFHDLAWRAVQKGPPHDPALMYLLARAQSLGGRPQDALVTLTRLAERGIPTDVGSHDDFAAVRRLRGWPELAARTLLVAAWSPPPALGGTRSEAAAVQDDRQGRQRTRPSADAPTGSVTGASALPAELSGAAAHAATAAGPVPPSASDPRPSPRPPVEDALRVPAMAVSPVALAYDRASGRFLFGDAQGRKLLTLDERLQSLNDLVRSASAGFFEITALEIDARRGDLWVVSADRAAGADSAATALHHVQLVSGRPIAILPPAASLAPARFEDVAVTPSGIVHVLDTAGGRIFRLQPRSRDLQVAARLELVSPASIAPAGDGLVYVAHAGGLMRVDLASGSFTPVNPPEGSAMPVFARVRWYRDSLVGVEPLADGTSRIVRVPLDRQGRRARRLEVLDPSVPMPQPTAAAIAEDALYLLARPEDREAEGVVRRLRLR